MSTVRGRGEHVHQQLFADLLEAAGLDSTYLGYLDEVPAESLAVVNLMSLFGLHRRLRGAAMGHFASTEITSSPGSRRLVEALQRMGAPADCIAFYREHVEADAVHEQVVRTDVVGDLIARSPSWSVTSCSACGPATWSKTASPVTCMDVLDGRSAPRYASAAPDASRRGRHRDGWCRTTDSPCCADRYRSPP